MATTIKVDGTVADFTWQDDQTLDPAADVDLVVFVESLTKGYPRSAVPAPTVKGASGTDTVKSSTGKAAK